MAIAKSISKAKRKAILRAFRKPMAVSEKRIADKVTKYMTAQGKLIESNISKSLKKSKFISTKAEDDKKPTEKQADKIADDIVEDAADWKVQDDLLTAILVPELSRAAIMGAETSDRLFKILKDDKKLIGIRNDRLIKWAKTSGSSKVKGINGSTKKKLRKAISKGLVEGQGFDTLMDRIQEITKINKTSRVRTIARTESHSSITTGNFENMKVGGVKKKRWVTSRDELVRGTPGGKWAKSKANHFVLDNEIRDIDKPFSNGLMYPGDPSGPPEEIINDRCVMVPADF